MASDAGDLLAMSAVVARSGTVLAVLAELMEVPGLFAFG